MVGDWQTFVSSDAEEEVEEKQEKREPGLDARWLSVGKKRRVSWLPLSL